MKKLLTVLTLLVCFASIVTAAPKKTKKVKKSDGKVDVACPSVTKLKGGIAACPATGCGRVDPLLNQQKNLEDGDLDSVEDMKFEVMYNLSNKVAGYNKIGDPRDKLADAGEGNVIRVVAFALDARKGSKESCNCGFKTAANTDNHIVLVAEETLKKRAKATPGKPATATTKEVKPRSAAYNTLKLREKFSLTAEFAPHARLNHPELVGAKLKALITAQGVLKCE